MRIALTLAAFLLCSAPSLADCPGGHCPVTPLRSAAAAVVRAAPVRSAVVVTARVAVAPVRYVRCHKPVRSFARAVNDSRPRVFQRFVYRVRCR